MSNDNKFGFNTTQAKTLDKLLAGVETGGDRSAIEDRLDDLETTTEDHTTSIETLQSGYTSQTQVIDTIFSWANALVTKLNADSGVADTNYPTLGAE